MENQTAIIFVAAIGMVLAIIIAIFIMRKMKWSIKITLDNTVYNRGEKIRGTISIKAKKQIESQKLVVTLACDETTTSHDSDGDTENHTRRLYEESKNLAETKDYHPGEENTVTFDFTIPTQDDETSSKFTKALKTAAKIFGPSKRITRKVETRLYAKGLDLRDNKVFKVNKL